MNQFPAMKSITFNFPVLTFLEVMLFISPLDEIIHRYSHSLKPTLVYVNFTQNILCSNTSLSIKINSERTGVFSSFVSGGSRQKSCKGSPGKITYSTN